MSVSQEPQDPTTRPRARFKWTTKGPLADEAPELNGVPLVTCNKFTLTAEAGKIPELVIELQMLDGFDLDFPADVTVIQHVVPEAGASDD